MANFPGVIPVGPTSTRITCPSCRADISTRVAHEPSVKTHLIALVLCILFCPCVCIPYCTKSCQSANHYCPNCQAFIGSYSN